MKSIFSRIGDRMVDPMKIYQKIKSLQKDMNLSNQKLCELSGVSHSVLDNWKKRKTIPSIPVLEGLCDTLGISLAQLFSGDKLDDLSQDAQEFFEIWSTLTKEDKRLLSEIAHNMRNKYQKSV